MEIFMPFIIMAVTVLIIAGWWKIFVKAGQPSRAILIPVYNIILLLNMAGKPWWWIFLLMIPLVNFVVFLIINIEIAKRFGKSAGFGVGMALLCFIFVPMLGFSDATYNAGATAVAAE